MQRCSTHDVGTLTIGHKDPEETVEDRYRRCGFLNTIQHIDIYGKFRSSYTAPSSTKTRKEPGTFNSISSCSRKFSDCSSDDSKAINSKLSGFSVTTKVSGLWPGHDILSKRMRKAKMSSNNASNFVFSPVVMR